MPSTDLLVSCEHLVKVYDSPTGRVQAVRGVDLELPRGVKAAVVGPSGSGKSSLLRMVAGLDRPTAGLVTIAGTDLSALRPGRRARVRAELLTHVYQRPAANLLAHLTAYQQLDRIARPRRDRTVVVGDVLERLGLGHRVDHVPAALSGGEQQRLAFARAAVADHRLVIADEPTAQLDPDSAAAVLDTIDYLAERGTTVLIATHDHRVLGRLDEIVTLRDGAVASIVRGGTELAVIDRSGRLQLPPHVLEHFPERSARLDWDGESLSVDPP
ncbi:MAG: ATP-binding cassette domain-containing protein [Acidimicrobiia bacterium]|nr:ATP-binding cassette domain-containing protein [Acidimicrobiia bacterium]